MGDHLGTYVSRVACSWSLPCFESFSLNAARMRNEIDLDECEHFLKVNLGRTEIDLSEKRSECERSNANWDRSKQVWDRSKRVWIRVSDFLKTNLHDPSWISILYYSRVEQDGIAINLLKCYGKLCCLFLYTHGLNSQDVSIRHALCFIVNNMSACLLRNRLITPAQRGVRQTATFYPK